MEHLFEGFRIVDAGSLLFLIVVAFWWLRQLNKGTWHSEREVQALITVYEKRIAETIKDRDDKVADARAREVEWRRISAISNDAANIMRSQLTAVVGELQIVGKTMHAINPSIQTSAEDEVER